MSEPVSAGPEASPSRTRVLLLLLKRLRETIGDRRLQGALVLSFATALSEWAGLSLVLPLLAAVTGEKSLPPALASALQAAGLPASTAGLLALLAVAATARALLSGWQERVLTGIRIDFVEGLRLRLFTALCRARWPFLMRQGHGLLSNLLGQEVARIQHGMVLLLRIPVQLLMILAQIAVALWISIPATLGFLVVIGSAAVLLRGRVGAADHGNRLTRANSALFDDIAHFLTTLKAAKANRVEALHVSRFGTKMHDLAQVQVDFTRDSVRLRVALQIAAAVAVAALIQVILVAGDLTGAELLVLGAILFRLAPVAQQAAQGVVMVVHMLPAFQAVEALTEEAGTAAEGDAGGAGTEPPPPRLRRSLACRAVGFRYQAEGPPVLDGLDLELRQGDLLVLSGRSGSGKTTLADILGGLLSPTDGRLEVDGMALDDRATYAWRRRVAYMAQEPAIYDATVRENLLWGERAADESELWAALTKAAAAGFVESLPRGLDEPLGPRGNRLSGGQRQRLSLAHALLRQPDLLILDEPTSALDADTERQIIAAVSALRGSLTVVVITHRAAEPWKADVCCTLDRGRISELRRNSGAA